MVRLFPSLASEYSLTLTHTHTHRFMRGLPHNKTKLANDDESLRRALRWDSRVDGKWLDRDRLSLLMYAVVNNNESIVRDVVKKLRGNHDDEEYKRHIDSRVRDQGFVELGIPGKTTILFAAMSWASPEIVTFLIESGANERHVDKIGNDAFMYVLSLKHFFL